MEIDTPKDHTDLEMVSCAKEEPDHIEYEKSNLEVDEAQKSAVSSKTLKRCLSVPIIKNLTSGPATRSMTAATSTVKAANTSSEPLTDTPKKQNLTHNLRVGINRSNPSSREVSPAPTFNIFAPKARRYSASYSPLNNAAGSSNVNNGHPNAPLCVTPRVSQLRKEECLDVNSREVNHEREVHNAMQMSQSWEDLTLVTENWSCKSDEFSNPLQVVLPSSGISNCSSPSPTSTRTGLRLLPYGLSPSPTRRTFATRRSMSPIAMRPSQLCAVKRKFEMEEGAGNGNGTGNGSSSWNVYSPPPLKKIFTESRGSSPSSVCPSPDSGAYDGRITPKLFISKLCATNTNFGYTNNNSNSACSSPMSASSPVSQGAGGALGDPTAAVICSSSSSSSSCVSEPMSVCISADEGISVSEDKLSTRSTAINQSDQLLATDMQDDSTLMDDTKSETSSIGGCSAHSFSTESASCDGSARLSSAFLGRFQADDISNLATIATPSQRQFSINKLGGNSGIKKFIVNHDTAPAVAVTPEANLETLRTEVNADNGSTT